MRILSLPVGILALLAAPTFAQFPYNPTRILLAKNGSDAYIFQSHSSASQINLQLLNTSDSIDVSKPDLSILTTDLPFPNRDLDTAFTPIIHDDDLVVLAGGCDGDDANGSGMWHFSRSADGTSGTWDKVAMSSKGGAIKSPFLSSGFPFSPSASLNDTTFYFFAGMCPNGTSDVKDWTAHATYSDEMLAVFPDVSSLNSYPNGTYTFSYLHTRGPPVAEAGLTITPLTPTYSNNSDASVAQQQNFVLIGGHTQEAFINMSQVALFSLPEESWSFQSVAQPDTDKTDLMPRSGASEIEPRSGHTAVLTKDGNQIVVVGGWVGDVSTPAQPQLAILDIGQGYGGAAGWKWTVPSILASPFKSGQGIYGHGAAMLEGDMMLISGGYSISASNSKRRREDSPAANPQMLLFNVTSSSFETFYKNPVPKRTGADEQKSGGGALRTNSQKAGLGAGLVLGFAVVSCLVAVYILYSRRLQQKRAIREKEIRELALGADRYYSGHLGGGVDGRGGQYPATRSASWASRQERRAGSQRDDYPWAPVAAPGPSGNGESGAYENGGRNAERTGLLVEIPSPTRGLRRSLYTRGPIALNSNGGAATNSVYSPSLAPGEIHTIAEQDEESEAGGSIRRVKSSKSRQDDARSAAQLDDPFKDPPPQLTRQQSDSGRVHRDRELQGWVEDWKAAGAALDSGKTHRSTSIKYDSKNNNNSKTLRSVSPEKSDRTNSSLSENSTMSSSSIQRSLLGTLSRNVSMRSVSAGYTLFANAAAAMTGRATLVNHPGPGAIEEHGVLTSGSSRRSASLNFSSDASTRQKASSRAGRDRADTFSSTHTAYTTFNPSQQSGENDALLSRGAPSRQGGNASGYEDVFETPPESPTRDRGMSAPGPGRKALGWMGSMRRALTGTTSANGVRKRIEEFEQRAETASSPHKPQMTEISPHQRHEEGNGGGRLRAASASAALWRGKRGAKDWDVEPGSPTNATAAAAATTTGDLLSFHPDGSSGGGGGGSSSRLRIRRKPVPGQVEPLPVDDEDEADEWDVEAAVQRRLVQVMFTVPKEKLRVVNADQLSLMSRSDVDPTEGAAEGKDVDRERDRERSDQVGKRVSTVVEESEGPSPTGDRRREREMRGGDGWKGKEKEKPRQDGGEI